MSCCPRQEDAERRGAPKKGCEWLLVTHEPCRRDELVSGTGPGGAGRAGPGSSRAVCAHRGWGWGWGWRRAASAP